MTNDTTLRDGDPIVIDTGFRQCWLQGRYRVAQVSATAGCRTYRLLPITSSGEEDDGPRADREIVIEERDPVLLP